MRIGLVSLLAFASAAQAQVPSTRPITVTGHPWAPFISPMGEPFRAHAATDDTLADWFQEADRNHDGTLTPDEMVADAERFFATLDANHDGQIDPDELSQYEWEIAPDVQVMTKTRRQPGQAAPAPRPEPDSDQENHGERRHGRRELDGSLGLEGGLQGAARYGLLDLPEPVAAADTDFDRVITIEEFKAAAVERFQLLDSSHAGRLTLAQLEAVRPALDGRAAKHKRDTPDARIGESLPPAP